MMNTKQIIFTKINTAEFLNGEYDRPKENEVTVSLEYSAISSGTERANITGDPNNSIYDENTTKDMICEIHMPEEAPEVYTRLINDRTFPIGVLFDWTKVK